MIWQNAWAWIGLGALLLPVLIHLLGRGHARVQSFPTLRFLSPSRLLPTRRTRLHDLILLAVRVAILLVAVMALAQPFMRSANRRRPVDRMLARAVVLDTSTSMRRLNSAGERAIDVARRDAQTLRGDAQTSTLIEASDPSRAIAGALGWLGRQNGRSELVVLSDFQVGALDAADFGVVPSNTGIRLQRLDVAASTAPIEAAVSWGRLESVSRAALTADGLDVTWTVRAPPRSAAMSVPAILAGAAERAAADAAERAAGVIGAALPLDTSHAIAIVYPGFEQRAALIQRATPLRSSWAADFALRLARDPLLTAVAAQAVVDGSIDTTARLVVARNSDRAPVVIVAEDTVQGRVRLLLFSLADAGSSASAALIASSRRAASVAPPVAESDPAYLPDSVLARLQRAPAVDAPSRVTGNGDVSDGRWFWAAVLLLLALEAWLRRAKHEPAVLQLVHDRAA